MNWFQWACYMVGFVFISSGVMKLIFPRFIADFHALGLPFPSTTVFLVAIAELACGTLIVVRLHVRKAAIPLLIIMAGAIFLTKFPILISQDIPIIQSILSFAFEARLDLVMIILLLLVYQYVPDKKLT